MSSESLIQQAIQKNKVRKVVINYVERYNEFVRIHNRNPRGHIPGEQSLYMSFKKYSSLQGLTEDEIKYLQDNLVKIQDVRLSLINFVEDYNNFVTKYGRPPQRQSDTSLYLRMIKYINPNNLSEIEVKYLEKNGINVELLYNSNLAGKGVKRFVEDYLKFIDKNGREPSIQHEKELYKRMIHYTNPNNLSEDDVIYLERNGIKVRPNDKSKVVGRGVKGFVEEYKEFVEKYHRKPDCVTEKTLYGKMIRYTNANNLSEVEIEYLEDNDIEIRYLDDTNLVRKVVKKFVAEYKEFVEENGREPKKQNETNFYYKKIYYTNSKNLTEAEIRYLEENGISVRTFDRSDPIGKGVKNFVQEYKDLIEKNGRKPRYETERGLYDKMIRYTNPKNLSDDDIKYLKENGIEIRSLDKTNSIRESVIKFVQEYNAFVTSNGRNPLQSSGIKIEEKLSVKYRICMDSANKLNLNDVEKQYIEDNLIKISVRHIIKNLVDNYKDFVITKGREPKSGLAGEHNLYTRIVKNTNPDNLNPDEIKYLELNGISVGDYNEVVRLSIKLFVREYMHFIKVFKRVPNIKSSSTEEVKLYLQFAKYSNEKNINNAEKEFLKQNNIEVKEDKFLKIRRSVREFVREYNDYISTFNRKPKYDGDKCEQRLYRKIKYYTKPERLLDFTDEEIEYLQANGIKLKLISIEK
ncbi:MAG: hypothetical protein ACLRFE_01935 [Clostridia bacterium]